MSSVNVPGLAVLEANLAAMRARDEKWDSRFLELAKHISSWSKDSTKVGAVIVAPDRSVLSLGYNGLPRGVEDSESRYTDRNLKLSMIVHAEPNAIIASGSDLTGSTIYVWPFMPCSNCAGAIIQAGIRRCVAPKNLVERWQESFKLTRNMFAEAGVLLREVEDVVV